MDYPAICLLEKETNNKVFIVPNKEALVSFAKNLKNDEESNFLMGIAIFKSLLPENTKQEITPSYLQSNSVSLHTIEVNDLIKGMKKFEDSTLLEPKKYDAFFVMDTTPVAQLEPRDWSSINEIVSLNRGDTVSTKPKIH